MALKMCMFLYVIPDIRGSKDLNNTPPDKKVASATKLHCNHSN